MSGLVSLPWSFKPFFGYLFDKAVAKLKSTRILIIISCTVRVFSYFVFINFRPGFYLTYFMLFLLSLCKLVENITCEYLLVLHSKKMSLQSNKNENFLPYFFGFRALGAIIGNFLGGRILEQKGMESCYKVCADLALLLLTFTYFYQENMQVLEETKNKTFI